MAKLTKQEREDIKKEYEELEITQVQLAKDYGVSNSTISKLVRK